MIVLYFLKKIFLGKNLPKKICAKCKRDLSVKEYNSTKAGHARSACRRCENAQRTARSSSSPSAYLKILFSKLKHARAKEAEPLEWTVELEQLSVLWEKQEGKCALSGVFLTWQTGEGQQDFNMSIDRKDPNKGYVPENIQLVAFRVNVMKHILGESEFYWWCKNIVANKEQF